MGFLALLGVLRFLKYILSCFLGLPVGTSGKEPACRYGRQRDMGSIPGLGRSPGEGYDNSF